MDNLSNKEMLAKSLSSFDMVAALAFFSLTGQGWPLIAMAALLAFFTVIKKDMFMVALCIALAWGSLCNPLFPFLLVLAKSFLFFSFNYFTFLDIATVAAGAAAITFGVLTAVASVMMVYLFLKSFSMYVSL
jgi:hypothetical protein